jgi:aminoglycoside 6'-N-acetyltransferase I
MELQNLSAENLNNLVELVLELWVEDDFTEAYEHYQGILDTDQEACFLVKVREQFIAFIHIAIRNDYVEGATVLPVAYIEGLYVRPNFQQQGIARKLISAAETWAIQKGITQLASDTETTNEQSIIFHKKTGFTEVGRIVCFIKNL